MDTNIKIVGFANQSVNGININNEGFDIDYDGNMLNLSGFSGDKMYYAKLNNQQIMDLLQTRPSQIPLEQRILQYKQYKQIGPLKKSKSSKSKTKSSKSSKSSKRKTKSKTKSSKRKTTKKHNSHKKSISKVSSYKSPKMRSEIKLN